MGEEKPLKSAFELAMERLRAKDREAGIAEPKPLTEAQKRRIAELRQELKAKLAEMEILHEKALTAVMDKPEELVKIVEQHRQERERLEARYEAKIEKVRRGEADET